MQNEIEILKTTAYYHEMLKRQIAVYTGKRDGGLASLQNWYHRNHKKQQATICDECNKTIETEGHSEDCQIIKDYDGYFDLSPSV